MATLFDLAQAYLNRGMPSISPIFSNTTPTPTPQPTPPTQDPVQGLTPEQLLLLSSQGGGRDDPMGGGAFGNLDLSDSKTFTKDVYDEELGDFIPTELTGYKNLNSGLYQTFGGQNINPAFSNTGLPSFGLGSLAANLFGFAPKTVGGYKPGSIRGFYDRPGDFFNRNRNEAPGMTPAQMTRRKKGLESLGKIYENIGRTRDRIRPGRDDDRGDRGGRDQDGGASAAAQSDAAAGMGGY
jgi:hypothetical protein